jgi:hypothetical protein
LRVNRRKLYGGRSPENYGPGVSRPIRAEDLVGAGEIAERLGLASASLVHDWTRRYDDFPTPIARLKSGKIWLWPEVKSWATETGRL